MPCPAARGPPDFVPPSAAPATPQRQFLLGLAGGRYRRRRCWTLVRKRVGNDDVLDVPSAAAQDLIQSGAGVGGQVKTISHLDGIGRTLPTAFGVRSGTIAHDDLDTRVTAQPVGEYLGSAIVE